MSSLTNYGLEFLCFRVADKDWGADFRKLSGGSALVALTLWLDHMQASLLPNLVKVTA